MKTLIVLLSFVSLSAAAAPHKHHKLPDIPPDATSAMYRAQLKGVRISGNPDGLDPVQAAGERNLRWLDHMNSFRAEGEKISLTSKDTQRGTPIDRPYEYNPQIILADFAALKRAMPAAMREVIYDGKEFTRDPPVDLATYIEWGRKADLNYQGSSRWRIMSGWLSYLEERRHGDIRGVYFLSRLENRAAKLREFASLPAEDQAKIRGWLVGMCFNNDYSTVAGCQREVNQRTANPATLEEYYRRLEGPSLSVYRDYFTIPSYAPRSEYRWEARADGSSTLHTPFLDPVRPEVRHFMQFNNEDEWKFGNWDLKMPLVPNGKGLARVIFEPGATPHVNGLGGDTITMDANQPLTEYDAQWTIRHEFGHVLGLPDCYVEFYEADRRVIVNYQIDIENIMCSRRGHVKAENVEELRRAYGRR